MNSATKLILFTILVILIGTGTFLVNWKIPAPVTNIEKVISDGRFPK